MSYTTADPQRLDPAAYRCLKGEHAWTAEGPGGNTFTFRAAPNGEDVEVTSHTGGRYLLAALEDGTRACNCPASLKGGPDKHLAAYQAVRMAAAMGREAGQ